MTFFRDRYIKFNNRDSQNLFFVTDKKETIMSKSIATQSTAHTQGVKVQSAKYDAKKVTLSILFTTEMLEANDIRSVHDLKRQIAGFFDSDEPVELWDSKDPTVYCLAMAQGEQELTFLGNKTATCTIELTIPDGLYYNVHEDAYTATRVENTHDLLEITIDSNGTADSNVRYEVTMNGDMGYFGVATKDSAIEFGTRDEWDAVPAERSVVLTQNVKGNFSNWQNGTTFYENTDKSAVTNMTTNSDQGLILPTGFTNSKDTRWFGAIKEHTLSESAQNWYLWSQAQFETGVNGQTGCWTLTILDKNNKVIAGMVLEKVDTSGNTANVFFLLGDGKGVSRAVQQITFVPSVWRSQNPYGTESAKVEANPFDIRKSGDTIMFYYNGTYFSYVVPELATVEATKLQFFMGQLKGQDTTSQMVSIQSLNNLTFRKDNAWYWKDVPNRYKKGDKLVLDSATRVPLLNNMPCFQDQLKGSEYSKVHYGTNKIQFYYSNWAKEPQIKVFVREAYI